MHKSFCSFCGVSEEDTAILITGRTGAICEGCAEKVFDLSRGEMPTQKEKADAPPQKPIDWKLCKPQELYTYLNDYVIGQEQAKKFLSVAVYNHYKRLKQKKEKDGVEIKKSNVILIGPSGVGKTFLVQTIARKVGVPCVIADATSLTQEGYVGQDPDSIVRKAYNLAGNDVKAAERSIIYIDEFDKLRARAEGNSTAHDVGGQGVQEALLTILEGTVVNIAPQGNRKHPDQKLVPINTENILFICGGAFQGLDKIVKARLQKQHIGFQKKGTPQHHVDTQALLAQVSSQDLKSFGLIPEIVGRLPVTIHLEKMTIEMLRKILMQPKNALIKQYKKLFAMEDTQLHFEDEALDLIAQKALEKGLGARSLRSIVEKVLMDDMFLYPSKEGKKELTITKKYVLDRLHKLPKSQ